MISTPLKAQQLAQTNLGKIKEKVKCKIFLVFSEQQFDFARQCRQHFKNIPNDAIVSHLKDGCILILVDRHNTP
jgi:hypothetical protein